MLNIRDVEVRLKTFTLGPINLDINLGEYFVILGPSGAGKTMLLEVISGFRKSKGTLIMNGKDISNLPPEKRNIGFLTQEPLLFPHMNVRENILFGVPKGEKDRALKVVKMLRIEELLDRDVNLLSGGEKQRVALARALASNPLLILLDEPFSWLDPEVKEEIMEEFLTLTRKLELTVLHVTHDFREGFFLADRLGIMQNGKIIQVGTSDEIIESPLNEFVAKFIGIQNVYQGEIREGFLCINGVRIGKVKEKHEGTKRLYINPYRLTLIRENTKNEDWTLKGKIQSISYRHPLWKVKIEGPVKVVVFLYSTVINGVKIKEGEEIFVRIPCDAVKFMD